MDHPLITVENATEIGRAYLGANRDDPEGWWVINSVWLGEDLDDDTHLALVLGALDAAKSDADLWLIGDGPVEEGLAPRPRMIERVRRLRRENASVDRMWRVMQEYHADVRKDRSTWWHVDS
jgi:hypothetical protein